MSILEAPEMELELPISDYEAFAGWAKDEEELMARRAHAMGLSVGKYHDEQRSEFGLIIIGPPEKVLRLIPGLYEREAEKRDVQRYEAAARRYNQQFRNIANDREHLLRQAQMAQNDPLSHYSGHHFDCRGMSFVGINLL